MNGKNNKRGPWIATYQTGVGDYDRRCYGPFTDMAEFYAWENEHQQQLAWWRLIDVTMLYEPDEALPIPMPIPEPLEPSYE